MKKIFGILGAISFAAVCFAQEPGCSRFHYEEKLLEKVIGSENKIESLDELLKKTTGFVEETMQTIKELTHTVQELQKEKQSLKSVNVKSSGLYTRWGRRSCPGTTELVYGGFAGGGFFMQQGASSNNICLPTAPIFDGEGRNGVGHNTVYGAEYQTSLLGSHDEDVPCAVCRVVGKSVLMIPARNACYSGWNTEYSGYLMSEHNTHNGNKELVCIDGNLEKVERSDGGDQNGALLYFVNAGCGSLKCPPYGKNQALTCVVCSK